MSKKIIAIDFLIPGNQAGNWNYVSEQSLLDADVIVFNPLDPGSYGYLRSESYQGKPCFDESGSFKIKEATHHWHNELQTALIAGKTIFVLFAKYEEFFVHTGQKQYSGTGRNTRTTNIVTGANNYEFCPVKLGKIIAKGGNELVTLGNPVLASLWSELGSNMSFASYIDAKLPQATFLTRTGERTVGAIFKVDAGHLVLIPPINYNQEEFTKISANGNEWNKKGVAFGSRLVQILLDIDNKLRGSAEKSAPPDWLSSSEFELAQAKETKNLIYKAQQEIKSLEVHKTQLEDTLLEKQSLQDLLFEQGKPLEQAVIKALKILGYRAENYDDGTLELDQVIVAPEGFRYIGECEGKNEKDIDISKFRQLSESLSADFAREEVSEKAFGILFGNPQRLTEPDKRTLDFTAKCKIGAEREKIALLKTPDLFIAAKYLQDNEDEDYKRACRDAIHSSLGKVVIFPSAKVIEQPSEIAT